MADQSRPAHTILELWTPEGPVHRRVSTTPPRPATLEEIPIVDLKGMKFEGREKAETASAIRTAAMTYGFFYIKNHGIPQDVITNALVQAKSFFSQPEEDKMLVGSHMNRFRNGFAPVGSTQINRAETRGLSRPYSRTQRKYADKHSRRKRGLPVPLPAPT